MDFWRTIAVLNSRKWLILFSVALATLLTYGATRLVGNKWMANVKMVSPDISSLANVSDGSNPQPQPDFPEARDKAAMYTEIAKSREVIMPALNALKMTTMPPNFLDNVEVVATSPTNYELHVTDTSPSRAEAMANAIAEQFIHVNHKIQSQNAAKVVSLLQAQLNDADSKVNILRKQYDNYANKYRLIGTPSKDLMDAITKVQTARVSQEAIQNNILELEAQISVRQKELDTLPKTLAAAAAPAPMNPDILQLQGQLDDANNALTILRSRYTDANPQVQSAIKKRDVIKAQLNDLKSLQTAAATTMANPAWLSAQQTLGTLQQQLAGLQAQLPLATANIARAEAEYNRHRAGNSYADSIWHQLDAHSELRANLASRLSVARLALDAAERDNPLVIVDRSSDFNPPVDTSAHRTIKLLLLAVLCSFLGVSSVVVALDSIDQRVKNVSQMEGLLPGKVLAAIPQPLEEKSYAQLARSTELDPQSLSSEAYRFLGLHLLNSGADSVRSLMVLSAKAEQGSTTTVTNLAITLAQSGKRVIIVDANVRTSEMHQVFEIENEYGFTDVMTSPTPENLDKALRPTSVPGLWIMTSGVSPHNPWELFRSPNLLAISDMLHQRADFILYDTPSALIFTDALNLAPVVDAAFLCVRALEPLTGGEQRLIQLLQDSNVKVLGSVISHVPTSVVEGYHNYQHYYGPSLVASRLSREKANSKGSIITPLIDIPGESRNGHGNGNGKQ